MKQSPPSRVGKPTSMALMASGMCLCLWPAVSGAIALVLGLIIGLIGANNWIRQTSQLASQLLQISIVGLGAGMNLAVVWSVGIASIEYTIVSITLILAFGLWLGRTGKLSRNLTLLIASGTAICGGSAIAAIACVIKPREEETTTALATVFLLNAVGLLLFPTLGHLIGFTQHQFGLWAALAIHDTSSVVGASAIYGETALKVATTVKLVRALWIVPLTLIIAWSISKLNKQVMPPPPKIKFPWFIGGFLAMAALATYLPGFSETGAWIALIAKRLLVVALFLVGTNLTQPALAAVGWRPLIVGTVLWIGVSISVATGITAGWIH